MPKSKNSKDHKRRVNRYKLEKKKSMEILKKKMIDEYIRAQQQQLAEQKTHTSTQEVTEPEIEVDTEGTSDISDVNVDVDVDIDNTQIETPDK